MTIVCLWIALLVNTVIYRYIGRAVISQPRHFHPRIFWNPKILTLAVTLPILGFVAIAISGFVLTDKGWSILAVVLLAGGVFAVKPHPSNYLL